MQLDAQTIKTIDEVAIRLSPKFNQLPGYSLEDIQQECRVWCLELLQRNLFDANRGPLMHYLVRHVRRRLLNLRRDRLIRADAPCKPCHNGSPCTDGHFCEAYERWRKNEAAKLHVRKPSSMDVVDDGCMTEPSTAEVDAYIS